MASSPKQSALSSQHSAKPFHRTGRKNAGEKESNFPISFAIFAFFAVKNRTLADC
jgi:hypothetical protein